MREYTEETKFSSVFLYLNCQRLAKNSANSEKAGV